MLIIDNTHGYAAHDRCMHGHLKIMTTAVAVIILFVSHCVCWGLFISLYPEKVFHIGVDWRFTQSLESVNYLHYDSTIASAMHGALLQKGQTKNQKQM